MNTDHLTGALTQAEFKPRLREEIRLAARANHDLSLFIIDVDHFKSVNDGFGHSRGDQVLADLARRICGELRETDLLFRYGGDEFVLLLLDTPRGKAMNIARTLVKVIAQSPFAGEPPISLTVSIGQATFPEDAVTAAELFEEADLRLYEAKRAGRGRAVAEKPRTRVGLDFDEKGRLIEREDACRILDDFLGTVKDERRVILTVTGPRGSGRTRFLDEVAEKAGLQGYKIIKLNCIPALKQRPGFSLAKALKMRDRKMETNRDCLFDELNRLLDKDTHLLISIDNINYLDFETLSIIRQFLGVSEDSTILVAYSVKPETARRIFFQGPVQETIELGALSKEGLRVWLRTLMAWEPDEDFVSWLHEETSGLPGSIKKGLAYLLRREMIVRKDNKWLLNDDLLAFKLSPHIGTSHTASMRNLPEVLSSFVGREAEIEEGKELLERSRLVTIQGPGGIGKTRLALQIAAESLDKYPDGVYYTPLVSVQSADLLIPALADALEFSFYGNRPPSEQLIDFLSSKEVLIVLDGFEHLVQDAEILVSLLKKAPELRFLVTSRQILNLQAEAILELGPMDVPTEEFPRDIRSYSSVQLFLDKARRVSPGFVIPSQDSRFVGRICRLVEGVPLGIELAASWVRSLTVREIAAEIDRGYDFLTSSMRDFPQRHRSLRFVFDYSWELLGPKEKDVFRKLSVFTGSFTRHAAENIAGASLPLLSLFIDKSLISRDSSGRYHMLELLRRYARDKLEENTKLDTSTRNLHSRYYGDYLHQRELELTGAGQNEILAEISCEIENIKAGFSWSVSGKDFDTVDRYISPMNLFYQKQGSFAKGYQVFSRALDLLGEEKGLVPARIKTCLGAYMCNTGNPQDGLGLIETSLETFNQAKALRDKGFALYFLGVGHYRLGNLDDSERFTRESLNIRIDTKDKDGEGTSLSALAGIYMTRGDYDASMKMDEEALSIFTQTSDLRGQARVLNNLGNIHVSKGNYPDAMICYEKSLGFYRELGHKWGMGIVLGNLSEAAMNTGDYGKAKGYLKQSLSICREIGDQEGVAYSLSNIGETALAEGNTGLARDSFKQAFDIARRIEHPAETAHAYQGLGNVTLEFGSVNEARNFFQKALDAAVSSGQTRIQAEILVDIAKLEMNEGNHSRAAELAVTAKENSATEKDARERANKILEELRSVMTSGELSRAVEEGKTRGFKDIVEEIFTEI